MARIVVDSPALADQARLLCNQDPEVLADCVWDGNPFSRTVYLSRGENAVSEINKIGEHTSLLYILASKSERLLLVFVEASDLADLINEAVLSLPLPLREKIESVTWDLPPTKEQLKKAREFYYDTPLL